MRSGLAALFLLAGLQGRAGQEPAAAPLWSDAERLELGRFWSASGRYEVKPLEDPKGSYKVRLTPEASVWLWTYNRARGLGKTPPGKVPPPQNPKEVVWEKWIDSRVAYDRWLAARDAARENGHPEPLPVPIPEPIPYDLAQFAGEPPAFANCVRPLVHRIRFDDADESYQDNVLWRPRYAYYRFPEGVNSEGTPMKSLPAGELESLLSKAAIPASEARVFRAVSLLEGGFDAVNTYDTGFVSIGFLQFASLKEGGGSLGEMMLRYKSEDPQSFTADFRRFGIDVTPKGLLAVVEPKGGEIRIGSEANTAIIQDPRLVAVFGRACRFAPFRIAQLKAARTLYYPGEVVITLKLPDRVLAGKVKEIVKSEAGMAILMDRKVNTGRMGNLTDILFEIATANNLRRFSDLASYERAIVEPLIYRVNTLKDPTLSQPAR